MFPLVTHPNIRTSTHHSHNRPFRPVGPRCARENVLVRSSNGELGQLFTAYHVAHHPPHNLKSMYFLPPFRNQEKNRRFFGFQNKVRPVSMSEVNALTIEDIMEM